MSGRSYQKELLDADDIPAEDLFRNLYELDLINTRLGGHAITQKGFRKILSQLDQPSYHVMELGCGGGDNLRVLADHARRQNLNVKFTGVDLKPDCIRYAEEHLMEYPEIEWICSDFRNLEDPHSDILFSSLFCHHLNDDQMVEYLIWNQAHSRYFFINDLHRHALAKSSIQLLTQLFSKSYLVKNDAPLSVMRGFKRRELEGMADQAGLAAYDLSWEWAFRWLFIGKGDLK